MNKKSVITILKFAISFGIIGWLGYSSQDQIKDLLNTKPDWKYLFLAMLIILSGVSTTFYRWYILVRALDIPFKVQDGFRLGFLGYLFNFVSLGAIGGDFFKAFFIAKEQPDHKTHCVLTVVFDRVIGLLGMFLMVTIATLFSAGFLEQASGKILTLIQVSWVCSGLGILGLIFMQFRFLTESPIGDFLIRVKYIGPVVDKMLHAFRLYRKRPLSVLLTVILSVATHFQFSVGFLCITRGLRYEHVSWGSQMIAVPLSMIAAVVPLPGGGLGALEGALDLLYAAVPNTPPIEPGVGLIVAITYRVITVAVAMIGLAFYLKSRGELDRVMKEAQEAQEAEEIAENEDDQSSELDPGSEIATARL